MLISIASAKGSPGASTSAHVLAAVWPRPAVLAELDPAGSDLVYRARSRDGLPLDSDRGVVSLAAAIRRDPDAPLQDHLTLIEGDLPVLVGLSRPDQATAIGAGWLGLATSLHQQGDVIADVGRLAPGAPSRPGSAFCSSPRGRPATRPTTSAGCCAAAVWRFPSSGLWPSTRAPPTPSPDAAPVPWGALSWCDPHEPSPPPWPESPSMEVQHER